VKISSLEGMVMSDDIIVTAFPNWAATPMNYTITHDLNGTPVSAIEI
jgi:hypothetical protein